jgi:signal transduction histidine kinase
MTTAGSPPSNPTPDDPSDPEAANDPEASAAPEAPASTAPPSPATGAAATAPATTRTDHPGGAQGIGTDTTGADTAERTGADRAAATVAASGGAEPTPARSRGRSRGPVVRRRKAPFSLRQRVQLCFVVAIAGALLFTAAGAVAFVSLLDAREALVDRADPGLLASSELLAGLVDQETGVRAYVLSADDAFLGPYEQGADTADAARDDLDRLTADLPAVRDQLPRVDESIAAWRDEYAEPTIAGVRADDAAVREEASLRQGRALFDDIRAEVATLQGRLTDARADARDQLATSTVRLLLILAITAVGMVATAAFLWRLMRRNVEEPIEQIGRDAQQVAGGDLEHLIEPVGPAELQALAVAMDQMRQRIVDDLEAVTEARDALEHRTDDLARSNAELEQFAYVASHDLQEPLRKVASFCQLLQARYQGQLDERADQYIGFAVDGAKRMQALINDLLAFSRVGRLPSDLVELGAGKLVDEAMENLSTAIEASAAEVTVVGPLPRVRVEKSLGVALFQNLISNAIKFRQPDAPPRVHVSARRARDSDRSDRGDSSDRGGAMTEFTVSDDGIGIPPEYAERIFIIFQRLHGKDDFAGTGIGLALCRKIVEGHGGRIWVDTAGGAGGAPGPYGASGTTIRFTLPAVEGDA